jgi:imidazolonepropionase-like amidohydrolase
MHRNFSFLLILMLTITSYTTAQQKSSTHTALTGAMLYDGTGKSIENSVVIIKDGVIVEIGDQRLKIPKSAKTIDLSGKFITPGLIDSHVHFAQTGFFDGRPDVVDLRDSINFNQLQADLKRNPEPYYEAYLRSGVTAVYDVGGFPWSIERQVSAEKNLNAPHVAAAGPLFSGYPEVRLSPFNTDDDKQMIHLSDPKLGREIVQKHSQLGSTGIKIWGLQLNDETFMNSLKAVADETNIQKNKLIVHATDLDQAKEALRLGAKVLVHSVDNAEIDDEFIQLAQANNTIYLPTLTVTRGYLKTFRSLKKERIVNDPNDVMDTRAKELLKSSTAFFSFYPAQAALEIQMNGFEQMIIKMEAMMATNLKKAYESGITIAVATDAGNPGTFHGISIYDEMEAMQKAGIPASAIITMATQNGSMAMERSRDFGTLEKGKMADLIILDKNPSKNISNMRSITHVMRGGQLMPVNEKF